LAQLRNIYGRATPAEKETNQSTFNMAWNHAIDTIEIFLSRLEDCYIYALRAKPAITMEQLIDKAVTGVQLTGLYPTVLLEWNGFDDANQTWPELKSHFTEAYNLLISSGGGTAAAAGYHGANNANEADDDSFNSIQASLTNIQMANNANAQSLQDGMSAISARTQHDQSRVYALYYLI